LLVECFLGVALALARERFDHSIQTREQLENDAGLRVLGFLPVIESWRAMVRAPLIDLRHFSFSWPRRERLARIFDDRSGGAAEMLFGLKLVIDDNVESKSAKVIGITSPRAGDGKTTLAFNLASSIAAGLTSLQAEVAHIMAVVRTRLADMDVTYNPRRHLSFAEGVS
jgi:Mrp family chromosome partitioning ATPase